MICPKCGFDNPVGTICGNCGTPLAVQAAPVPQPPTPKPKNKNLIIVAVVAVIVVIVLVLATVMFVLPKSSEEAQSSPDAALNMYVDSVMKHNATNFIDSIITHFDTANRTAIINSMSQGSNMTGSNVTITATEDISPSSVPTDIKSEVTNFTNAIQRVYSISVQDSQFVKVTIKFTNSSTDSYSQTEYVLCSKVAGKWYVDPYISYSTTDWGADRSMSDRNYVNYYPGQVSTLTTPTGSLMSMNSSSYWIFSLTSISNSTVKYSQCMIQLLVGSQSSSALSFTTNTQWAIYLTSSTGFTIDVVDGGTPGYLSAGDYVAIGPIGGSSGLNVFQPAGTSVTLILIYTSTGGTIAETTLTV